MTRDPHILTKIATCPTLEELDAMCAAFRERDEELPQEAVQAVAWRRVELQRKEKRHA